MSIEICNLRDRREFADVVADRVWRKWWQPMGVELAYIVGRVQEGLVGNQAVPSVFVAHEGPTFAGTASLIVDDLDVRRQYTPWVAAVWVEPAFRSRKVGAQLVDAAAAAALIAGHQQVYLCARKQRVAYYDQLGWTLVEENVGPLKLTVFKRDRQESAA